MLLDPGGDDVASLVLIKAGMTMKEGPQTAAVDVKCDDGQARPPAEAAPFPSSESGRTLPFPLASAPILLPRHPRP